MAKIAEETILIFSTFSVFILIGMVIGSNYCDEKIHHTMQDDICKIINVNTKDYLKCKSKKQDEFYQELSKYKGVIIWK